MKEERYEHKHDKHGEEPTPQDGGGNPIGPGENTPEETPEENPSPEEGDDNG